MLISEFIERTGFNPTEDYYHTEIEPEYDRSDLDKDAWCKQWKKNGGIQKAYDAMCRQAANDYSQNLLFKKEIERVYNEAKLAKQENERLKAEVAKLQDSIDTMEVYREEVAEGLVAMAHKYSSYEMRDEAIRLMSERKYIDYVLQNDFKLWDEDKKLIIELINNK